jgi:hypothetical protein
LSLTTLAFTKALIDRYLTDKSAVLWSGGKDSQVLLHLCQEAWPEIPIIQFASTPHPTRRAFIGDQIQQRKLSVQIKLPVRRDIASDEQGNVELVNFMGADFEIFYPHRPHPQIPATSAFMCAFDWLRQPTDKRAWGFDVLFSGSKHTDVDPVWPEARERADVLERQARRCWWWPWATKTQRLVYPLYNWTDEDVWAFSRQENIAQDVRRYQRGDISRNPDYDDICVNCLKPNMGAVAYCPKSDSLIPNVAQDAQVVERGAMYRQQFLQLRGL